MRTEDFAPDAPGRLVKAPEGYWTFEPSPLPPNLLFDLRLARQLSEADQALGELPQPLLYLSAFLERNSEEYKDHLLEVSRRAAWVEWIYFFARGVAEQARDAVERVSRLLNLWQTYRLRVRNTSQSSTTLQLVDELFASPFLTIPRATQVLGVTYPAAQSNMKKLEELGIVREITGQKRNRIYQAREILALLDALPPQPTEE